MIISAVFSLDMLGSGDFEIKKYEKDDKERIVQEIKKFRNDIVNTMIKGDATKIVETFLEIKLPEPKRESGIDFSECSDMLFIILSGMNLKTQKFQGYEEWMGLKFFFVKRK